MTHTRDYHDDHGENDSAAAADDDDDHHHHESHIHLHIESPRTWHFKNMQPFHNSGAEQRHGCIEHVSTHPTNIGHLNQSSQLCLKNDTYLQPPTR
jgi:hypothetical protein